MTIEITRAGMILLVLLAGIWLTQKFFLEKEQKNLQKIAMEIQLQESQQLRKRK